MTKKDPYPNRMSKKDVKKLKRLRADLINDNMRLYIEQCIGGFLAGFGDMLEEIDGKLDTLSGRVDKLEGKKPVEKRIITIGGK